MIILLIGPFLSLNFQSIFLFSGVIAISDFIRSKILTGFPWNLWAYSFSGSTEIIQVTNKLGLFAFNLIAITIFMIPSILFLKEKVIKKILSLIFSLFLVFSFYIYGNHSINKNKQLDKSNYKKENIKVVSPNFKLEYGLNENDIESRLNKLIRYSEPDKTKKTLFVWPEGVFSGYSFEEIFFLKENFSSNFNNNHHILFGINRYNLEKKAYFNSLVIVNNQLDIIAEYKKQKLVPFGEFLPFENLLKKIGFKKVTEGHVSFLKGDKQNNLILKQLNILPLICYEIIFPELSQSSSKNTNVIVNISEDEWFGKTIGPYQHFSKGIFRAIEQNLFVIRSANKGISAIINNKGEVVKKLNQSEAGNIELEVH